MENKIRNILSKPLKEEGLIIYSIAYENKTLSIILDSDSIIDLDKVVEASHIINDILDKEDIIKEEYLLDISSKEKGDVK